MASRIDIIGQNGGDGLHYGEIGEDYIDKIRRAIVPEVTWKDCTRPILHAEVEEKGFVKKLVEDHWNYIKGILAPHKSKEGLDEIEYHYKTAMEHGWRHAKEFFTGSV